MPKLTSVESTWSRAFLHDLFEAGGLIKTSVRSSGTNRMNGRFTESAKTLCNEIKYRAFDFPKTDAAIQALTECPIQPLHESGAKYLSSKQIANIIANFCAEKEIFWDDVNTLRTSVEMDTYRMSFLGSACWNFKCFLSQQSGKKTSGSTRAAGGAPKSGYKSSGPKSGVIKGLVGEPGEKTHFSSSLYVLVCDSAKKKKQYVFIDPLSPITEINKIRFGDPSGWSSCKIFFDSYEAARTAMEAAESGDFRIPSDITGLHIERAKADPNGFFKVKTELGEVYIKASKLNEAIEEALKEEKAKPEKRTSRFPEINDIDVYAEALQYRE
jgi:hypothetical protein